MILLQLPGWAVHPLHLLDQFLQKSLVKGFSRRQVIISHTGSSQCSVLRLLHHKKGQTDLLRLFTRACKGGKRTIRGHDTYRNGAHHGKAFLLQAAPCKKIEHSKDRTQHDGDDHHDDRDKLKAQTFQHSSSTSRR